ncbi:MAG TPA: GIY-YIG nuclease family protein [Methylomirabilota bacterium]|nr:GIY-YIG nuclease family protein [Methylomirabilota bacterium]
MHYTYVLLSRTDGRFYTGATSDLRNRVKMHAQGRVRSTSYRRPLTLVYYEACLSAEDAYRRERYLKSGRGGRYLRTRLESSLALIGDNTLERH